MPLARPKLLVTLLVTVAAVWLTTPYVAKRLQARAVLIGLSAPQPETASGTLGAASGDPLLVRDVRVVTSERAFPARIYAPPGGLDGPRLVVAHGVHHLGIDEPRLVRFVRELAKAGAVVFTPQLDDLTHYKISERSVDDLVESTRYFSALGTPPDGRVGLIGFSFAGGLSLLAGTDEQLAGSLEFVASIGGHHDLTRVLRFFIDNSIETPAGRVTTHAHEYGLIVLVHECLAELLPQRDVGLASRVLQAWLMDDRTRARSLMAEASSTQAEELFSLLEDGQMDQLEPRLRQVLDNRAEHLSKLSPSGKLQRLAVPAYLLHGAGDTVIPASETAWADIELESKPHLALVSPLVVHVELGGEPNLVDRLKLVDFMARLL